jgi:hypothetical protein
MVVPYAVRFHIATVMYGWRLALVPLEPVELTVTPVVLPEDAFLLRFFSSGPVTRELSTVPSPANGSVT